MEAGRTVFEFEERTHESSEGQHIVFYLENELVGGGEIRKIQKADSFSKYKNR